MRSSSARPRSRRAGATRLATRAQSRRPRRCARPYPARRGALGSRPRGARVKLEQAFAIVRYVLDGAPVPVSVYVTDLGGEVVAAATMDGAEPGSRAEARRKAVAGEVAAF